MFTIKVEKECGCFKRSGMQNNLSFESKDEALLKSIEMRDTMNDEFCKKHEFSVQESSENFIIKVAEAASSGCCGGGCGSH